MTGHHFFLSIDTLFGTFGVHLKTILVPRKRMCVLKRRRAYGMNQRWERFPLSGMACKITYSVPVCNGNWGLPAHSARSRLLRAGSSVHPKPQLFLKEKVPSNVDPCHPAASRHDHQT